MNALKKMFKGKKAAEPVPRPMEDIKKEYQAAAAHAGGLQYELEVKKAELNNINGRLLQLNKEADARQRLDQAATKASEGQANESAKN